MTPIFLPDKCSKSSPLCPTFASSGLLTFRTAAVSVFYSRRRLHWRRDLSLIFTEICVASSAMENEDTCPVFACCVLAFCLVTSVIVKDESV